MTGQPSPTQTSRTAATGAAVPVASDRTGPPPAAAGDDIVVTARRGNESLRNVPAAVSVLTADKIAATGARVGLDFVQLTSGIDARINGTGDPSDFQISIRGLNKQPDGENNVALVVDGVLKPNNAALNQPQGDLQQVEILKGPQGALYGRSASAGAIVITTKKPGDHLEGALKVSGATDNTYLVSGLISGPISPDVGFVLNGEYTRSDGYFRNSFVGTPLQRTLYPGVGGDAKSIDEYEDVNVFGRILITPSSDTTIDLKANYGRHRGGAISYNATLQLPALATAFGDPNFNIPISKQNFVFNDNNPGVGALDSYGASMRLAQQLGSTSLSCYVSYNNTRGRYVAGGTSAASGFFDAEPHCIATRAATTGVRNPEPFQTYPAVVGGAQPYQPTTCDGGQGRRQEQKDVETEIRLASVPGDPFQWQVGASYIFIDRRVCQNVELDTGQGLSTECFTTDPRFPTESLQDDNFRTNVYAGFASAEYAVTSKLKLGAAFRYDIEVRDTSNNVPTAYRTRWVGNPAAGVPNGTATTPANYYLNAGLDPRFNPSGVLSPRSSTFRQPEPKLTIAYKATDDLSLYASWGIGFKAGGFNGAGSAAIVNSSFRAPVSAGGIGADVSISDEFKKETNSAFEAGVKGKLFRSLNFELTGFYTQAQNVQFLDFFVGTFGFLRAISNIDRVRFFGGEASVDYRVLNGVSVFASTSVVNSRIEKNSSRPYTVGNRAPSSPDFTVNAGVQVQRPLVADIGFSVRADARITGPTAFHTVQDNDGPTVFGLPGNFSNSIRPTYAIFNLRAGLTRGTVTLTAFVSNLLDKRYIEDDAIAPEFGGGFVSPGARRRFGLEAAVRF